LAVVYSDWSLEVFNYRFLSDLYLYFYDSISSSSLQLLWSMPIPFPDQFVSLDEVHVRGVPLISHVALSFFPSPSTSSLLSIHLSSHQSHHQINPHINQINPGHEKVEEILLVDMASQEVVWRSLVREEVGSFGMGGMKASAVQREERGVNSTFSLPIDLSKPLHEHKLDPPGHSKHRKKRHALSKHLSGHVLPHLLPPSQVTPSLESEVLPLSLHHKSKSSTILQEGGAQDPINLLAIRGRFSTPYF